MSNTVIKIENLSKIYRLGEIGTGTLSHDLNRWWAMNIRGKNGRTAKARSSPYYSTPQRIGGITLNLKTTNH
ncbi:hypothetical protein [Marinilabilia salmonicolor]|uniref:ABC transporter family protein n=1 Tax=Marinilabilia salmonicolor TaxID=989 RepID=A0A368UKZ1_9BACT|nr:hypothetical protein [Marinilabilia salmonicolor]RCW27021.1 hypothetical protein DFO77_1384 [Marinilabilia salmonicolor]